MPAFRNRVVLDLARGVKAFLTLETGITRGPGPDEFGELTTLRKKLARGAVSAAEEVEKQAPPFFVVGQKKSGTTWLMKMIDSHPDILCRGEGRFFGKSWRRDKLKESKKQQQPTSLYNAISSAEDLRYWIERSPWGRSEDVGSHVDNLTRLAVEYFLTQELLETEKSLVGDKSPLLTPRDVEEIGSLYPEAKIIHIIRDGRDTVVSAGHHIWNFSEDREGALKLQPEVLQRREAYRRDRQGLLESGQGLFAKQQIRGLSREWASNVGAAIEHGRARPDGEYIEVFYEDLLSSPEAELTRLLEFLGAGTDEDTIERCVGSSSFDRLSNGRQRGEESPTSFFRKGVAGDWKNSFTKRDKQVFKKQAGKLLVKLGYESDERW